jgi:spore maturation protein CgeB
MKVLFCGLKYEYGNPKRGMSFEYKNFYDSLRNMPGLEAEMFAMDEVMAECGRDEMNRRLISRVQETKPDLLFCFLFTEEIKKETIGYITRKTSTKTFNWFGDDHWRFPVYSRHWAPLFTAVSTTDEKAFADYKSSGIKNVIKTQWAANPFLYKPQDRSRDKGQYQITFFGQNYGSRSEYIKDLQEAELPAQGHGHGWLAGGGIDPQEMLDIYSFSKISLNFSETPYYGFKKKLNLLSKLVVGKELGRYKFTGHRLFDNIKSTVGTQRKTIKARTFEVPACGGFLLTGMPDDDLSEYYEIGKEVEVFRDRDELIKKCRYYLDHDSERQNIAKAGYERTIREHTYPHRFKQIFKFMGLN